MPNARVFFGGPHLNKIKYSINGAQIHYQTGNGGRFHLTKLVATLDGFCADSCGKSEDLRAGAGVN